MEFIKEKNAKNKLYLMCGLPASGKSYLAKELASKEDLVYISRDEIRFELLKDGEGYFSKERQVFREFKRRIQYSLDKGKSVVADATHISFGSRAKTLNALNLEGVEVIALYIKVPFGLCLGRNDNRCGRAKVPRDAMISMHRSFSVPEKREGFSEVIIKENNFELEW